MAENLVKVLSVKADIGDAQQKLGQLQNKVRKLQQTKRNLNKAVKDGTITQKQYSRAISQNTIRTKKAQMGVRQYSKSILVANGAMKKTSGFVMGIRKALTGMAGQFLGVMAAFMLVKNVVGIFKDFEQANADLAAVLGKTSDEITDLSEDAKRLGASTAFTATEVSQLQKEFAKLGFSTNEILNATEATLNLAAATGTDLARAAEVAGSTTRAFGLSAKDTKRVTDVMAKSFSSSALDMEKFATSMRAVAPVAKNAGLNIEQTTSMLGVLVDRGVDASTAGTSLRNVFLELSKQGLTFEEAMEKINTSTDKNKTALELFGKRGAVVGTILAETGEDAAILEEKLNNAGGAAKKMADTQLDTLSGALTLLNSAWEGFILSVEDGQGVIGGTLRGIIDITTNLLSLMTATDEAKKSTQVLFKENTKNISKANDLKSEYESLAEKTNLTTEESRRLSTITGELSDMFGTSVVNIDKETGALSLNTTELVKQIAIRQALQSEQAKELLAERLRFETQLSRVEINKEWLNQLKQSKDVSLTILDVLRDEAGALGMSTTQTGNLSFEVTKLSEAEQLLVERIRKAQASIAAETIVKQQLANVNETLLESGIDLEAIALQEIETSNNKTGTIIENTEQEGKAKEKSANDLLKLTAQLLNEIDQLEIDAIQNKQEREETQALFDFENKVNKIEGESELENQLRTTLEEQLESDLQAIRDKYSDIESEKEKKATEESLKRQEESFKKKEALTMGFANDVGKVLGEAIAGGEDAQKNFGRSLALSGLKTLENVINLAIAEATARSLASAESVATFGAAGVAKSALLAALIKAAFTAAKVGISAKMEQGGVLQGKSHARGGIPTIDGQYEFEGGEAVINKRSTAKYGALLSSINQAGGGVAFENGGITKFQQGGIPAPISFPESPTDISGTTEQFVSQMDTIKVVNVVTDTTEQQASVLNVTNEAEIG